MASLEGFLKCDAEGCGYRESCESISSKDIGKECPDCGANLLTQEDFDMSVLIAEILRGIPAPKDPNATVTIEYHDGVLAATFQIKTPKMRKK